MPAEESKKIFLDKRKLSPRYVPSNLPHRDMQLQELDNFFRDSLAEPSKAFLKALQIVGPAGSGKTSTVTHFGDNFEKEAKRVGVNLQHVYVNLKLHGGSRVLLYRYILDRVVCDSRLYSSVRPCSHPTQLHLRRVRYRQSSMSLPTTMMS
jgi:Cdc6-like AAA superfamily ATPase